MTNNERIISLLKSDIAFVVFKDHNNKFCIGVMDTKPILSILKLDEYENQWFKRFIKFKPGSNDVLDDINHSFSAVAEMSFFDLYDERENE